MRFVKVTDIEGRTVFINLLQVTRLIEQKTIKGNTLICTTDRNAIFVKETPEEILIKLPVVGG